MPQKDRTKTRRNFADDVKARLRDFDAVSEAVREKAGLNPAQVQLQRVLRQIEQVAKEWWKPSLAYRSYYAGFIFLLAGLVFLSTIEGMRVWVAIFSVILVVGYFATYSKPAEMVAQWIIKRTPQFRCPYCSRAQFYIDAPWACYFCKHEHRPNVRDLNRKNHPFAYLTHPFWSRCEQCNTISSALECPSCHTHIVFDPETYEENGKKASWLFGLAPPIPEIPKKKFAPLEEDLT